MQKFFTTLTLLFLAIGVFGQAKPVTKTEPKIEPKKETPKEKGRIIKPITDFRDIYWGSSLDSTYRGFNKVEFKFEKEMKFEKFYTIEGDIMEIGSVSLKKIYYVFDKENRFFKVLLEGDKKDIQAMSFILDFKYGKPLNAEKTDEIEYSEWLIKGIKVLLAEYSVNKFEVLFTNNIEAVENYKKNTHVDDF